ncbi:MAG: hypothetical protein HUJ25_04555 [Crocinitomicaceae bacterium]|nr:hypothetical protein [Crocinitomicaceae bacterium]
MYFSKSESSINLSLYKSILDKYLEERKDDNVRKLFELIILTTHKVVTKELNESKVDNKIYHLVSALSNPEYQHNHSYFAGINPRQIGIEQFRSLSGILYSLISYEHTTANA